VRWSEVEKGIEIADFTIKNVPARVRKLGDLWKPMLARTGRVNLNRFLKA
jgi:bifunctional non-homologous end joining protein LigD